MKTLSNNDFSTALKSLKVNVEAGLVSIQDEVGTVASYNRTTEDVDFNDIICVFDNEYELTEKQLDALYDILHSESEQYMIDMASAWCQADKEHANSLIYS